MIVEKILKNILTFAALLIGMTVTCLVGLDLFK